jgi:hypothetical protein
MSIKVIDKTLRGLPVSDRVGALIMSLAAADKDAVEAIQCLIGATAVLGKNLPDEFDRLQCVLWHCELAQRRSKLTITR